VVPLVSRRWRELANFPPLLAAVSITLPVYPRCPPPLPQVQSLCSWLSSCAAAHVVSLRLELRFDCAANNDDMIGQVQALLSATLARCFAAGQLEVLDLDVREFAFCLEPGIFASPSLGASASAAASAS
jgi:hypothetical protein